eukprot:TRINITY_DN69533_c0_g1_i1.p1 TRINITY_DN69533_c0_g1~~TRINITY_DN69533_c0_g1_i1.p1  ORF type:complete len:568 (+),score=122.27 TRINITY_DN69533_c0_g1_i1:74-1705(+)
MDDGLDTSLRQLFNAYDLDESGELSREEFLKIEIRLSIEAGEVFHEEAAAAKLSLADRDRSGTLDFEEFRERWLRWGSEQNMLRDEIVADIHDRTKRCLTERVKMGPRFHPGIRQALKRIFALYDRSGDNALSPEEWIAAQKVVALEISDDIDESWIDEAAFAAADENDDGVLQPTEFLEASFAMFEGVKKRSDEILATLQRVVLTLERQQKQALVETLSLIIFVQSVDNPPFQPPHASWQDEPTEEEQDKNASAWKVVGEVKLPVNLTTFEEVASVLRLNMHLPSDTWLSVFFQDACPGGAGGWRPLTRLRGDRPGEGNVKTALEYLSKENASLKLFVKNRRKRPARLQRQQRAFLEERDALLARCTGARWGFDWDTQIVGDGRLLPPRPLVVAVGDGVLVEVPQTDDHGEFRYVSTVFMDRTDILSVPVEDDIVPKAAKTKKKKVPGAPAPDPLLQLQFTALREGRCVFFVEVSWEDQEEKLAERHKLTAPVAENTVARVGPLEVEVVKVGAGPAGAKALQWWNGEAWSAKKGPAKKKKKR